MTRSQGIRRFRIFWRWATENPKKEKRDWPGWERNGGKYYSFHDCFLCDLPEECCPVVWPGVDSCIESGSLYTKWGLATGKRRAALAKQISELPVRRQKRRKND